MPVGNSDEHREATPGPGDRRPRAQQIFEAMAKVVLITGASAGIGQACADRLHQAGWTVVGSSRRGTASGAWQGLVMDVDNDESVRDGVSRPRSTRSHRRRRGVSGMGRGRGCRAHHHRRSQGAGGDELLGCDAVVQAVLPAMRAQGGGRIVLISSIGGVVAIPFQAFYSASKFALEGLGEALAYEVAPFGIDVTLVQPGNVRTDFTANRRMARAATDDADYRSALDAAVGVMERDEANGVAPEDVAAVVQRVLDSRRPPRRVSVGKSGERVGILAKRLLPHRVFEAAAKGSLGVK